MHPKIKIFGLHVKFLKIICLEKNLFFLKKIHQRKSKKFFTVSDHIYKDKAFFYLNFHKNEKTDH
jgi:hypothetical protein